MNKRPSLTTYIITGILMMLLAISSKSQVTIDMQLGYCDISPTLGLQIGYQTKHGGIYYHQLAYMTDQVKGGTLFGLMANGNLELKELVIQPQIGYYYHLKSTDIKSLNGMSIGYGINVIHKFISFGIYVLDGEPIISSGIHYSFTRPEN